MSNKELSVILRMRDEASRKLEGFKNVMAKAAREIKQHWVNISFAIRDAIAVVKAFFSAMNQMGITAAAQMEGYQVQLSTVLGSMTEAKDLLSFITTFAAKTPFEIPGLIAAATALENIGLSARENLEIIGNTAAAFGRDITEVSEALVSMNALVLRRYGIQVERTANKAVFQWKDQWGKMREITVEGSTAVQREALLGIWNDRYQGGMSRFAGTFNAMMSNLSDAWFIFRAKIGEAGFLDRVKEELQGLLQAIDQLKESGKLDQLAKSISETMERILEIGKAVILGIGKAITGIGLVVDGVKIAFASLALLIVETLQKIISKLPLVRQSFKDFATVELEETKQKLVAMGDEGVTSVQKIQENLKTLEELFTTKVAPAAAKAKEDFGKMAEPVKDAVSTAKQSLIDVAEVGKQAARNVQDAFADFFFDAFTGKIRSLKELVKDFGESMIRMIANIMAKALVVYMILGPLEKLFPGTAAILQMASKFHRGGMIQKKHSGGLIYAHNGLAPDEVPIIAQTGEGVLSRRGMRAVGGSDNLRRLNRGDSMGSQQTTNNYININAIDTKSFRDALQNNADLFIGSVMTAIEKNKGIRHVIRNRT